MDSGPDKKHRVQSNRLTEPIVTHWRWIAIGLGVILCLLWAWRANWPGPVIAEDINQARANLALPAPNKQIQIRQTFVPKRDGMEEVELMLVKPPDSASDSSFSLQLRNEAGDLVRSQTYQTASLVHNQSIRLTFPPERYSAWEKYTLIIAGADGNDVSVWGYDLDVHSLGEATLIGMTSPAVDLRFITRYQLSITGALREAVGLLQSYGLVMLLGLTFIILPGLLLLLTVGRRLPFIDPVSWWAIALALGLSSWPLLWLWLTVVGGRWRPWLLWIVFGLGWLAAGIVLFRRYRRRSHRNRRIKFHWQHIVLLLIFSTGIMVRLLAIRDLAFPPWVDSSHHGLITKIMAETGRFMRDYEPYLPVDRFPYHAGFHTVPASLSQMMSAPLTGLLLSLGQFINASVPLAVYSATQLMSGRRNAGLLAAIFVSLPFFFPAYYTTWGRLTQVTGLVILAVAIGIIWKLMRGSKSWRQGWWLTMILASGLFLVHFRAFVLFAVFVAIVMVASRGRHTRYLIFATLGSLILVFPQIVTLWQDTSGTRTGAPIEGYNAFPIGYLKVGWEQAFLVVSGAATIVAILATFFKKKWAVAPVLQASWVAIVALLLSGERLGLPETSLINLNSAYISMFLPMAIILSIASNQWLRFLQTMPIPVRFVSYFSVAALVMAMILFGIHQQVTILNPVTFLGRQEDVAGLTWLEHNVPKTARVAAGSWLWQGNTWAASDGGAWILPVTEINTTIPPIGYIYDGDFAAEINAFNEHASSVTDWSNPSNATWLRESGVDYIYIGPRGGFFDPAALAKNPSMQGVYAQDGVFIFAVNPIS